MKKLAAVLFLAPLAAVAPLPAASPAPNPGLVMQLDLIDHTKGGAVTTLTTSVEGRNLKMNMPAGSQGTSNEMIFHGAEREMLMIDHARKSYIVIDEATLKDLVGQVSAAMQQVEEAMKNMPPEQRAMMEQMMKQRGMGPAPAAPKPTELRRTGERGDQHGFAAEKYEVLRDGRKIREVWVTPWDRIDGANDARAVFEEMADMMKETMEALAKSPMGGALADQNSFEHLKALGGYPVVTREFDENGTLETETVLKSATRKELAPADFQPPAGYAKQTMGGR
jgi:hypothetical protein